jgi:tetraacyldisaccharide 4'-kinase
MIIDKKDNASISPFGQSLPVKMASSLFGAVVGFRNALYDHLPFLSHPADRPVISIGGIRAGGTGKTPVALMIGEHLLSKGYAVAFLSRGYRRKKHRICIVKPYESVFWEEIGDEPCLLHNRLPQTWLGINAKRRRSAARLSALLPKRAAFVLDDGFQHRTLKRDLDIVCLHDGAHNDLLIPSGFLREPFGALSRAHAALIIGSADNKSALEELRLLVAERFPGLCTAVLFQEMGHWVNAGDGRSAAVPPIEKPLLVCGIARPERFIAMVRKAGITPCIERIFSDHHRYIANDFIKTRELYSTGIITTEKDAVRLAAPGVVPAEMVWYPTLNYRFAERKDEERLYSLIDARCPYGQRRERECGLSRQQVL